MIMDIQDIALKSLSLDDILILPKRSSITSRKEIKTETTIGKHKFHIPIIAANMDTICNDRMAFAMYKFGGLGPIHRYNTPQEQYDMIDSFCGKAMMDLGIYPVDENFKFSHYGVFAGVGDAHKIFPVSASIGIKDYQKRLNLISNRINIVFIDVAHGHCDQVIECIKYVRSRYKDLTVVAGNVATYDGAYDLFMAGAHGVKVGLGSGSACVTRAVTGVGVPQATAIANAYLAKESILSRAKAPKGYKYFEGIPRFIIADGGIKNSGDIAKCIAIGADFVMVGALLAGTKETPGTINEMGTGFKFKVYKGMASKDAQIHNKIKLASDVVPEGIAMPVPYKGSVINVLKQLRGGLQSACSYVGALSLKEFRDKTEIIEITSSAYREGEPHGLYKQEWNGNFY